MELVELHVLKRKALAPDDSNSITGKGVGIGGGLEDLSKSTCRIDNAFTANDVNLAGCQIISNYSCWNFLTVNFGHDHVQHVELIEKLNAKLYAGLIQSLQNHVAGAVCCIAASSYRCFSMITGVATKTSLVDFPVWGSVEWQPHVFQVDNSLH